MVSNSEAYWIAYNPWVGQLLIDTTDVPDPLGFHGPGDETSFIAGLVQLTTATVQTLLMVDRQAEITNYHLPEVNGSAP